MDLDSPFFRIMESIIIIGHGASIYLPPMPAYLVDMYHHHGRSLSGYVYNRRDVL